MPAEVLAADRPRQFEFRPPGQTRRFLAVSQPLRLEPDGPALGAIVVAKPQDVVRDQWAPLILRLAAAIAIGGLLAWLLGLWLSQRISKPVEALARALGRDRRGELRRPGPGRARGRRSSSHLSERFNEMAARLAATEERERQFLMSVSHELRTPLTAIKGHVDALRDGLVDDPELVAASLDVVANEATRLERLVGDVLDLAKLRAHRFTVQTEEVDMGRLVEQAYGSFGDEARRREIDYALDGVDAAPTIITDGDRVLQVITNLLKNAFRWTPDGGSIGVALERRERRRARRRDGHRAGDHARGRPAHLQPVRLARHAGHRARPADRAGARRRARRPDRARHRDRAGQPLPARPSGRQLVAADVPRQPGAPRLRLVAARSDAQGWPCRGIEPADAAGERNRVAVAEPAHATVLELPHRRSPARRPSSRCGRGSGRRTCCSSRGSSSPRSSATRAGGSRRSSRSSRTAPRRAPPTS